MSDKLKKIIRAVCFLLVFCFVFLKVQSVVMPNRDWPSDDKRTRKNIHGLYNERANSIDLMLIGASHLYEGVSAMEIYRQTGLHPYVVGTPGQRAPAAAAMLKAVMDGQSPKVVAYDVGALFIAEENNKSKSRWQENLDALPITRISDRVAMARRMAEMNGDSVLKDEYIRRALLPLLNYHTNFVLQAEEFFDLHLEQVYYRKGYEAKSDVDPVKDKEIEAAAYLRDPNRTEEPSEGYAAELKKRVDHNSQYVREMYDFCKSRGSELLLIKVPVCTGTKYNGHWSIERHNLAQALADELGIPFLDMNYEDIGIDWKHDTKDEGCHLNLAGATKVSAFLSGWLPEHYDFNPVQSDALKADWDYQLSLYDWEMEYYRLQMENSVEGYFDRLRRGNYTVLAAVSGALGEYWNQEFQDFFDTTTGNAQDLMKKDAAAFALVARDGEVIDSKAREDKSSLSGALPDGAAYKITSRAGKADECSIKVNGREMVSSDNGLAIVVYDNDLKCVVDSVVFGFDDEVCLGQRGGKKFLSDFRIAVKNTVDARMSKM